MKDKNISNTKNNAKPAKRVHEWRECPLGEHWVVTHPMNTKTGKVTTRHGHCASNSSKKDQIYFEQLFGNIKSTNLGFDNSNDYDIYIRGWTKYWNDILQPDVLLDSDLIKSLIATESSFNKGIAIKAGKNNFARGLTQVTDKTLVILADEKGEIRDHYINLSQKELLDLSANICAGIRWLFRKKETASAKLKRLATWEEAVADYKAYLVKIISGKPYNKKPMNDLNEYYQRLKAYDKK